MTKHVAFFAVRGFPVTSWTRTPGLLLGFDHIGSEFPKLCCVNLFGDFAEFLEGILLASNTYISRLKQPNPGETVYIQVEGPCGVEALPGLQIPYSSTRKAIE